jgi:hypothetical protein
MTAAALTNGSGWRRSTERAAAALFVLLAGGALLWAVTHVAPRGWNPLDEATVTLGDAHYRVGPAELRWLQTYSSARFTEGEQGARTLVAAEIDARLAPLFAHARERLPEFADWYYSLRGEYSRMAMAALSAAHVAEPGFVAARATSMLFPADVWTASLERLEHDTAERWLAHESEVRAQWLSDVTRRLSAHRIPAPLPGVAAKTAAPIELDRFIERIVAGERAAFTQRISVSTLAGGGAALGPTVWRAVAARRGTAAAGKAMPRLAGRGAARVGSALAGGALVCSPSGPVALACGLAAGAAAWLGTDWLLLEIDERLHRDDLVEALEAGLDALHEQIERDLLDAYDQLIAGRHGEIDDEIRRSFVPAKARGPAPAPR